MPAAISTGKGSELSLSQTHLAGGRREKALQPLFQMNSDENNVVNTGKPNS